MLKFFLFLTALIVIGASVLFVTGDCRTTSNIHVALNNGTEEVMKETVGKAEERVQQIHDRIAESGKNTANAVSDGVQKVNQMALDASITAAVKMKLANDEVVSAGKINVDTANGVVTLSGRVSSQTEVNIATELAGSVDGVTHVVSQLQIPKAKTRTIATLA